MINYKFGEVVLVTFPQTGTAQKKKRPALVILDVGDADIVLAPITTKERLGPGDFRLEDWAVAGLLKESWVRLSKVACLEKAVIEHRLGELSQRDRDRVAAVWEETYRLG